MSLLHSPAKTAILICLSIMSFEHKKHFLFSINACVITCRLTLLQGIVHALLLVSATLRRCQPSHACLSPDGRANVFKPITTYHGLNSAMSVPTSNMAASGILPTYQRYVNGVPVVPGRRTLRLREKYIILLVFLTFGTVCFGAFFFLPDLRDRVNIDEVRKHVRNAGGQIFLPRGRGDGKIIRHHPDEIIDTHVIEDKVKLQQMIVMDRAKQRIIESVRSKLNISKEEHDRLRGDIESDKKKLEEKQKEDQKLKEEEAKRHALTEVKEHPGITISPNHGQPMDEETKKRRDTVKQVGLTSTSSLAT